MMKIGLGVDFWRASPPGSITTNTQHPVAVTSRCLPGWTVGDPLFGPRACQSGQLYQAYHATNTGQVSRTPTDTLCYRCFTPPPPPSCPAGWNTTPVPCAPGEIRRILAIRGAGGIRVCYSCLSTPLSRQFQQSPTSQPPPVKDVAQTATDPVNPPADGISPLKAGAVLAILGVAAILLNSLGKNRSSSRSTVNVTRSRTRKPTRSKVVDDEDDDDE